MEVAEELERAGATIWRDLNGPFSEDERRRARQAVLARQERSGLSYLSGYILERAIDEEAESHRRQQQTHSLSREQVGALSVTLEDSESIVDALPGATLQEPGLRVTVLLTPLRVIWIPTSRPKQMRYLSWKEVDGISTQGDADTNLLRIWKVGHTAFDDLEIFFPTPSSYDFLQIPTTRFRIFVDRANELKSKAGAANTADAGGCMLVMMSISMLPIKFVRPG